jgi:LytS/YehU family sensor histidine kinase
MCIYLADFLRASLRLGERLTIPFGDELELTRNYLQVEQVRFGSRLKVTEDIEPDCQNCQVPPLIVQPLVENAIKHGIATLINGGEISISSRRSSSAMRFVVENPFDPEAPLAKKSGIGLRNVRDRLATRFGGAARLEITIEENRYRVAVSLPCALGESA